MIKKPLTKKDKKHNQQAFYTYAANKTDIVDWRDANARICFQRKPYHMVKDERLLNEKEGREKTDDCGDH